LRRCALELTKNAARAGGPSRATHGNTRPSPTILGSSLHVLEYLALSGRIHLQHVTVVGRAIYLLLASLASLSFLAAIAAAYPSLSRPWNSSYEGTSVCLLYIYSYQDTWPGKASQPRISYPAWSPAPPNRPTPPTPPTT
jgi:hypothetical protein